MMKFLNLLTDELKRARGFYTALLSLMVVFEVMGISFTMMKWLNILDAPEGDGTVISLATFFDNTRWYPLMIGFVATMLLLYAVFMWLKEWLFKDQFIYRLLMLPGSRAPIAFAKVMAIFLMISGVLFLQFVILWLTQGIMGRIFGSYYTGHSLMIQLMQSLSLTSFFIPLNPLTAYIIYGAGSVVLLQLMNICIVVLSYKGQGWFNTAKTLAIQFFLWVMTIVVLIMGSSIIHLSSQEVHTVMVVFIALALAVQILMMYRLMTRYISV